MRNNKTILIFLLIVLLASFLRIYKINEESFGIDEGLSAFTAQKYDAFQTLNNVYLYGQLLPGHYPGISDLPVYPVTLYYWTRLFSINETSLRLYSALFGILTFFFVFLLARDLFGKKNAVISSLFFSINLILISYSQEARPYSLVLFFGASSSYFLIKSLQSQKNYYGGGYIISTILGLYTHFLYELLLLAQIAYIIFELMIIRSYSITSIFNQLLHGKKSFIRKIFGIFIILLLLSSPLVLRTFRKGNSEQWRDKPTLDITAREVMGFATWVYPSESLRDKIKNFAIYDFTLFEYLFVLSVILTVLLAYFFVFFCIITKIKKCKLKVFLRKERNTIYLLNLFLFPSIFSFLLSVTTPIPIFGPINYVIYSIPPFLILLSEGLLSLKPKYFKFFISLFILVNIFPIYAYYSNVDKQQWRELSLYLKGKNIGNDTVITSLYSGEVTLRYYYGDYKTIVGVKNLSEFKGMVKGKDNFWLILSFWKYQDPNGLIQKYAQENYELVDYKHFFDIDAYHYKKKN
ncbi:MAG: glycosyltransferase family 39 protein [Nanoarchaeota archaeon]